MGWALMSSGIKTLQSAFGESGAMAFKVPTNAMTSDMDGFYPSQAFHCDIRTGKGCNVKVQEIDPDPNALSSILVIRLQAIKGGKPIKEYYGQFKAPIGERIRDITLPKEMLMGDKRGQDKGPLVAEGETMAANMTVSIIETMAVDANLAEGDANGVCRVRVESIEKMIGTVTHSKEKKAAPKADVSNNLVNH